MIPEEVAVIAEALAGHYQTNTVEAFHDVAWIIYNRLQNHSKPLRSVL